MQYLRHRPALAVLCALGLVLLIGVLSWLAVLNHQMGQVPRFEVESAERPDRPQRKQPGDAMTVLLVGVDSGHGRDLQQQLTSGRWIEGSFRSDTIMLWNLADDWSSSEVVSIPRDSWVEIPGHGEAKVNAAFSYGGPSLLAHTLEESLDTYIDHVAIIDFEGFKEVTRTMGGVDLPVGGGTTEHLEGEDALEYVRTRKSLTNGDFDRINRQQHFLRTVLRKVADLQTNANVVRLSGLVGDLSELIALDDDFSGGLLRRLTVHVATNGPGRVRWMTAPHHGTGRVQGQSIVRLDLPETRELLASIAAGDFEEYAEANDINLLPKPDRIR